MNDWTKVKPVDTNALTHAYLIRELCEVLERRDITPVRLDTYERVVQFFPIESLKSAIREIYGQSPLPQKLPSPGELGDLTRRHAPSHGSRGSTDDERWRRQYDVWQRGRFSDEALEVAFSLSDAELGVGHEGDYGCMACQQHGCPALVPWPTERTDEGRMFCPRHQPRRSAHVTLAEKVEVAKGLTPKARAYVRSVLPQVMAGIPVTREEAAFAEPEERYRLVRAAPPVRDEVIAEAYGVSAAEVKAAQVHAEFQTMEPL